MIVSTTAIVLHAFPYSDSSHIVNLYTLSHGRMTVMVRGVHSRSKRFSVNYFQPLTILETEIQLLDNRDLQRLKDIHVLFSPNEIVFNIRKNCIAQFICEFLNKTLREAEANITQTDYLMNAIRLLEVVDTGVENFHLVFLLQFSKFLGIYPDWDKLREPYSLIQHASLENCSQIKLSRSERNDIFQQLLVHYARHFDGLHQFKSIKILHEILS